MEFAFCISGDPATWLEDLIMPSPAATTESESFAAGAEQVENRTQA